MRRCRWLGDAILWLITGLTAGLAFAALPLVGDQIYWTALGALPTGLVDSSPANDVSLHAIDLRIQFSQRLFEVSIIAVGAVWGFVFASPSRRSVVFSSVRQHIHFVSVSLLFIGSNYAHFRYSFAVSNELLQAGSDYDETLTTALPAIDLPEFQYLLYWQVGALFFAVIAVGLLLYLSYFAPPQTQLLSPTDDTSE